MERRTLIGTMAALAASSLAGCVSDESLAETVKFNSSNDAWLAAGEGIGYERGGDSWSFEVRQIEPDGATIDAVKVPESGDNRLEYSRKVEAGEVVEFQPNANVWSVEQSSDEVWLAVGAYISPEYPDSYER
jgi:hypothetical protein